MSCVYGYNYPGPHNLLTNHPMQVFVGEHVLACDIVALPHRLCRGGS